MLEQYPDPHASAELRRVLVALAGNRTPGWNFPANFLNVPLRESAVDTSRVVLAPGPHCVDLDGNSGLAALGVLADVTLAGAVRTHAGLSTRLATVDMALQFTDAPIHGELEGIGRVDSLTNTDHGNHATVRGEIRAEGVLVCTLTGSFQLMRYQAELAPVPVQTTAERPLPAPLNVEDLTAEEMLVFRRATEALAPGPGAFIDRFWGLMPQMNGENASCDWPLGTHVGNRVGQAQGGILAALAVSTACCAAGSDWSLVGASFWYIRPGTGEGLRAESNFVHRGRATAVIRVRIVDGAGRLVLEAVTSHRHAPTGNR